MLFSFFFVVVVVVVVFGMLASISYVLPSFSHLVSLNIYEIYLVTNETETWWNDLLGKVCLFFVIKVFVMTHGLNAHWTSRNLPHWRKKNQKKKKKRKTTEIYNTARCTKQSEDYIYTHARKNP